jgi:hypothetical protein
MISSVKLDKGVFSRNVIFTSTGLRNSGRRGVIEMLAGTEYNSGEEAAVITAIPKDKAANHGWSDNDNILFAANDAWKRLLLLCGSSNL